MDNQDYKIQKYTYKLKYAKNKKEEDYYKQKLQRYNNIVRTGGGSSEVEESIKNLDNTFSKIPNSHGYDKKQVDDKLNKLKSESEEWLKGLSIKFTDSEKMKSENEGLKKDQQELLAANKQLTQDKQELLENNKSITSKIDNISNVSLDNFEMSEDFLSNRKFLKDILGTETMPMPELEK